MKGTTGRGAGRKNVSAPVFLASCSPRRGGNSDFAVSLMQRSMKVPCRAWRIADEGVRPCVSCGMCLSRPGTCSLDAPGDGAKALFDGMCAAPVSVLACPVYFYHVPAQAKAWIDRAQRFWTCGEKPGRGRVLTAVLFGARLRGEKLFEGAERTFRYMALALGMTWSEPLRLYGLDGPWDLENSAEACARIVSFAEALAAGSAS